MANFECKVVKIEKKANHPNADRLTIYNIGGYNCISNKLPDGSDRYNIGDLVVYIPENAKSEFLEQFAPTISNESFTSIEEMEKFLEENK